jgi:hypothetical protein
MTISNSIFVSKNKTKRKSKIQVHHSKARLGVWVYRLKEENIQETFNKKNQ